MAAGIEFPKRRLLSVSAVWVLLLVGFSYLLTIAIAIGCVLLPFELLTHSGETSTWLMQEFLLLLAGIAMAAVILWNLVPRRDRFKAPGAELNLSASRVCAS